MDEDHFNHLVPLVSPLIKKEDTCMREAISPAGRVAYHGRKLGQRLNLNVRFDWLNTEICITLLHEMLQMVDTRRNLLRAMLQK